MNRLQQSGYALGSDVLLTVLFDDITKAEATFKELWKQIKLFEEQFSRFLPNSELTHFNQMAGQRVKVSPGFKQLLQAAHDLCDFTGGLYNPFILPGLQRAGYVGSWPKPDAPGDRDYRHRQTKVATSKITLDGNMAQIPADTALDFGGIGKGYLLDELVSWLKSQKINSYWLSLGGDIICSGSDVDGRPWKIAIQAAQQKDKVAGYIESEGPKMAVATSGVTKRRGVKDGKSWHHIIDPRTGLPAETDILTATVSVSKATEADVLAKCLVILGSRKGEEFIKQHDIASALIQCQDGTTKYYGEVQK
jgi:thiamine biosynthesis lipoprotein